jgi:hypothetical protein
MMSLREFHHPDSEPRSVEHSKSTACTSRGNSVGPILQTKQKQSHRDLSCHFYVREFATLHQARYLFGRVC